MASQVTQKLKHLIATQGFDWTAAAGIKVLVVDAAYTFDPTVDFVATAAAAREISATGYVGGFAGSGRLALTGRTINRNDTSGKIEYKASGTPNWASIATGPTIGGILVIQEITSDAASLVLVFDDLLNNTPTNGGQITYAPDTGVIAEN